MSKLLGQANIEKFEKWRIDMLAKEDWSEFKHLAYRGGLSRSIVSKASDVDLNALKALKGNKTILKAFDALERTLQKELPETFIIKMSSIEKYHAYVETMEQTGAKFPIDLDDDIDIIRLARNIGIPASRLNSSIFKKLLDDDIDRIGTEVMAGKSVEERMEGNLMTTSKELNKCRQDLSVAQEKIDGLTKQNLKLQSEVRKLQKQSIEKDASLEHSIETGRRFTL
ncbi:hypothetical protein [Colwellia sp. Bg11-28]|uniref:hypothetical protein n=1 Tax=Colwellia sp. Bg11-28 TaxID=2058305 RepID=UPI000C333397|nr:hypothetical protein [Colwellia sp. Bg11-28]PKH85448.1 hypothetical protein CXF79_19490 [Colwellia sp. Bg11-28]